MYMKQKFFFLCLIFSCSQSVYALPFCRNIVKTEDNTETPRKTLSDRFWSYLSGVDVNSQVPSKVEYVGRPQSSKSNTVTASKPSKYLIRQLNTYLANGNTQREFVQAHVSQLTNIFKYYYTEGQFFKGRYSDGRSFYEEDPDAHRLIYIFAKEYDLLDPAQSLQYSETDSIIPLRGLGVQQYAHNFYSEILKLVEQQNGSDPQSVRWGWTTFAKLNNGQRVKATESKSSLKFKHGPNATRDVLWWVNDGESALHKLRVALNYLDGRIVSVETLMKDSKGIIEPMLFKVEANVLYKMYEVNGVPVRKFCTGCHTNLDKGQFMPGFIHSLSDLKKEFPFNPNSNESTDNNYYNFRGYESIMEKIYKHR